MTACRECMKSLLEKGGESNPGLVLQRCLTEQKKEGEGGNDARASLLKAAMRAADRGKACYEKAFKMRQAFFSRIAEAENPRHSVRTMAFQTEGRLIIGLGGESPLETGLTLLSPYGVPVIPGCALKGLVAHYCDQVWGLEEKHFRAGRFEKGKQLEAVGDYYKALFGTTEDSGHITFHDAWIRPESLKSASHLGLVEDVMTPHHGEYYSSEGAEGFPTDFDEPNPVTFLSVTGKFEIVLECDDPGESGQAWLKLACKLLESALSEWGIGGKTSSGYGRMKRIEAEANSSVQEAKGPRPGERIKVFRDKNNKKGNPQVFCGKIRCRLEGEEEPPIPEKTEGEARIVKVTKSGSEMEYVITFRG